MKLTAPKRNEFDRAKHIKAIRVAHYELGLFIAAMYVVDRIGAILAPPYKWCKLAVVIIGFVLILTRWVTDSLSLRSIKNRLEEDALENGVEEIVGGD